MLIWTVQQEKVNASLIRVKRGERESQFVHNSKKKKKKKERQMEREIVTGWILA